MNISRIFKDEKEEYITWPAIYHFIREHNIKGEGTMSKREALDCIFNFGNSSNERTEIVLSWIDDVILEGIKDVYVSFFPLEQKTKLLLSNQVTADSYLAKFITENMKPHLCSNQYGNDFSLISVRWVGEGKSRRIIFTYCKKLFVRESNKDTSSIKPIDYPITAEFFVKEELLLVMAKPRTNLNDYITNELKYENSIQTTTEKEVGKVTALIKKILTKEHIDIKTVKNKLKSKLFYVIDKYTKTPSVIENVIASNTSKLEAITEAILGMCTAQDKCKTPSSTDVKDDIKNIAEKYLSINWQDTVVFTQDREAFPIKLSATDEEECMVEQTAPESHPLQTKSIFFDNKKMLQKNKSCNGAVFVWTRKNRKYCSPSFSVSINIKKEVCVFKFKQYTMKGDIENVIFSIIEADGETNKS